MQSSDLVEQRSIVFRQMRYIFSSASQKFELILSDESPRRAEQTGRHTTVARTTAGELQSRMHTGLTENQVAENFSLYGVNALLLRVPTVGELLYQEVFHPFNVFQMVSWSTLETEWHVV